MAGPHRRIALLVAFAALLCALAWPAHDAGGWTQGAHYALVRSLADGTPYVDRYVSETGDISYRDGHYTSSKAPGLALVTLPVYATLHAAGAWPHERRAALWLLALVGAVLPALLLAWLVMGVADELEPGSGLPVALTLGVATMMLVFGSTLFNHAWSAFLAFACFAVLLRERRGPPRLALVAAAGLIAGTGVVFEYPTAIAGAILGVLALARPRRLARVLAYGGGVLAGILPLLAYDVWAFGSPFTLSYADAVVDRGRSGHDVVGAQAHGIFGVTWPSPGALADLLLSDRGLLVTTPIVAVGIAGLVLLLREGRSRPAAWTALAIAVAYPLYNAGITTTPGGPFGGWTVGPRYLVTALPFMVVALGVAYRRAPAVVLALAGISCTVMLAATATRPLVEDGQAGIWWRALHGGHLTPTVALLLGWRSTGYLAALPLLLGVVVAAAIAARGFLALRRPTAGEAGAAAAAVCAWAFACVAGAGVLQGTPSTGRTLIALAVVATASTLAVAAAAARPPQ